MLETKGQDTDSDRTKCVFLAEYVDAVYQLGGFGRWVWDVSTTPGDIRDILARHMRK